MRMHRWKRMHHGYTVINNVLYNKQLVVQRERIINGLGHERTRVAMIEWFFGQANLFLVFLEWLSSSIFTQAMEWAMRFRFHFRFRFRKCPYVKTNKSQRTSENNQFVLFALRSKFCSVCSAHRTKKLSLGNELYTVINAAQLWLCWLVSGVYIYSINIY